MELIWNIFLPYEALFGVNGMKQAKIMRKHHIFSVLHSVCIVILCFAAGCAGPKKHYGDDEVRPVHTVFDGTVTNVSQVLVTQDPDLTGPIVGGVAGGVAGFLVGGTTMGAVGAVAGMYAAGDGDFSSRKYQATELTVELDDERYMIIIIGSNEYFVKGDPVRVLGMGEHYVRVQHK